MSPRVHTLPNGARVVIEPMAGLKTFALAVTASGGARYEADDQGGYAHLLEHMVFKGAGERGAKALAEDLEARGGQINAATGHERTTFQVRAMAEALPLGLEIVSDLVLRPWLDPAELAREKDVVVQEIAEAFDTPDDVVFELAQDKAFPGQPLGRPILGTPESVASATPERLDAFRRAIYAPERLVISIAGAVDEAEALALVRARFGDAPPSGVRSEPAPARFVGGQATLARKLEQANLVWQLPAVPVTDPDYFALRLFAEILGGGMASRLFQKAREERGLAYAIDAWSDAYLDTGLLGVFAGCAANQAAPLARLVAEEIAELARAPGRAELDRGKAQLKASLFLALESPLARAERSAAQLSIFDRLFDADQIEAEIDAVSLDDLARVGARCLAPKASASAALGPKRALAAADAFHAALFG